MNPSPAVISKAIYSRAAGAAPVDESGDDRDHEADEAHELGSRIRSHGEVRISVPRFANRLHDSSRRREERRAADP